MTIIKILILSSGMLVAACATKQYPIALKLLPEEASMLNCRELALEAKRLKGLKIQIQEISRWDSRSLLSFLGDYGIGNAMAESAASSAADEREMAIEAAAWNKRCQISGTNLSSIPIPPPPPPPAGKR